MEGTTFYFLFVGGGEKALSCYWVCRLRPLVLLVAGVVRGSSQFKSGGLITKCENSREFGGI